MNLENINNIDKEQLPLYISEYVEKLLKENYYKNLFMGQQVFADMILTLIEKGSTIEEIKEFCKKIKYKKTEKAFNNVFQKGEQRA